VPAGGPVVFTRRWDQLGGRLNSLVNAIATAGSLGLEFRFIWPRGADPAINDPSQLFSQAFLDAFEISPTSLGDRGVVPEHELVELGVDDARRLSRSAASAPHLEMESPFAITRLAGEGDDPARARFVEAFGSIGWSAPAHELSDRITAACDGMSLAAVHVRAGDIVTGGWRHVVHYGKYAPVPYVELAIEQLAEQGTAPVLVVSDNSRLLSWLQDRHRAVVTAAEIVPGYRDLPEILQAFADILLMARCHALVGPSCSAFSLFAAHVGCGQVIPAEELVPPGEGSSVLLSGIIELQEDVPGAPFLAGLLARDIVWYLDVFGDALAPGAQLELASRAVALDPAFAGARTRQALTASLVGDREGARGAAVEASRIAAAEDRHDDPAIDALAAQVAVECFALVLGRRSRRRWRAAGRRAARRHRRAMEGALPRLHRDLARLAGLEPTELDRAEILANLRWMVGTVTWLSHADDDVLAALASGLARWDSASVAIGSFRPPNEGARHTYARHFEAVVRNLERSVVYLSQAVGSAMAPSGLDGTARVRGHVDGVRTSRSGMQWLEGWVVETDARPASFIAGYALDVGPRTHHAGGAAASFRRSDVDDILANPGGSDSGFRIPVALDSSAPQPGPPRTAFGVSTSGRRVRLGAG
jgi:hypothetical protein